MLALFVVAALAAIVLWQVSKTLAQAQATALKGLARGAALLAVIFVIGSCLTTIPAGHVGVVDFFGVVSDQTLKSGINFRNPLAKIIKMSVKTQEMKETMEVPSREGLSVKLEVSALFHVDPEQAANIYKTVGLNFSGILLEPNFRSIVRGVTSGNDAQALYTAGRELLAEKIQQELDSVLSPRGLRIESTPMRQITLPQRLLASIEEKLQAEQESQRMQFVLQKEEQEAKRKEIEAHGISKFQDIVSLGITPNLLKWKGIEATIKLAESSNTKIVVIGAGKEGLPLILNQ